METYKRPALFFPFLFFFAWGCNGCLGVESSPEKDGSMIPMSCLQEMPEPEVQQLDILFVIDDSGSMHNKQLKVQSELTAFMEELQKGGGIDQSMNIGIISTSVYRLEEYQPLSYRDLAGKDYPGGRLLPTQGGNQRVLLSDWPDFLSLFRDRIYRGISGSPQETPFEAVRLALLSDLSEKPLSEGGNKGFLREGARLLVVVLSDEDDCSERTDGRNTPTVRIGIDEEDSNACNTEREKLTPVKEYYEMFNHLVDSHGRPREVIWTAIAPVSLDAQKKAELTTVCLEGSTCNVDCPVSMAAGFRHREMAEMFDKSLQNLSSICEDSYRETLIRIANMANVPQYIDLKNIPDKRLMTVMLTREDGTVQNCTLHNGGIAYWEEGADANDRIHFSGTCRRLASDKKVEVALFCVS